MPISTDQFEALSEDVPTFEKGTNAYKVMSFLRNRRDKAFKQGEIAEGAGVKLGSVGVVLARLHEYDLVKHKGEYWRLAPDARLGAYEGMLLSMDAVADHDAEFDDAEWDAVAAEDRD